MLKTEIIKREKKGINLGMQGDNEYSIEVQHVDKYFNIYYDKAGSFKEKILFWNREIEKKEEKF